MRNVLFVSVICSLLAASCGLVEIGEAPHSNADGIWTGPSASASKSDIYVTAFEYPDGYDWYSDVEKGSVRCSLVLFAGKIPVLKIPVGDAYQVSSEPFRHRVIGGHLYTDYADSSGTVIKKDGKELFRFVRQEEIACMSISGGQIHTLGVPPEGGFCYRIDGEIVVERSSGRVFRHMVMDDGQACFCFSQPVASKDGIKERFYSCIGGKTSRVELDRLADGVWDMMIADGTVNCLVSMKDLDSGQKGCRLTLFCGSERTDLFHSALSTILTCSFSDQECLTVSGAYSSPRNNLNPYLWTRSNGTVYLAFDRSLAALHVDEGGVSYAINPVESSRGLIASGKKLMAMPEGYVVIGHAPIARTDSTTICLGLSSRMGESPILWNNVGEPDTLDVNGYIATVSANAPR